MEDTMTTTPQSLPAQNVQLSQILESAVIVNWSDLVQVATGGLLQVEYHVGGERSVDSLKMWCNTARGYWSLICDYSVNPGWSSGPRFSNGFHSRGLGRFLESIMMNQNLFQHGSEVNSNVVIQISPPTQEEIAAAKLQMEEAFPAPVPTLRKAAPRLRVQVPSPALL
jgi:hypothetical protein